MPPERIAYGIGLSENTPDRPEINSPPAPSRSLDQQTAGALRLTVLESKGGRPCRKFSRFPHRWKLIPHHAILHAQEFCGDALEVRLVAGTGASTFVVG